MDFLYHFARTPPGLRGRSNGVLKPHSSDIQDFKREMSPKTKKMYGKRNFIYTIPKESLRSWKNSGQFESLLDTIVKMEWMKYSVEQWKIFTKHLDLKKAFVRETYSISPEGLGFEDYQAKTQEQKDQYHTAYLTMINSITPFNEYTRNFKNPEILLPFNIPTKGLTKVKIIR